MVRKSSIGEKPISHRPRRLADWINPTGTRKVHSLVDKVYKRKNLFLAWEKVKANGGSGGVDGVSLKEFEERLDEHIARLHEELKTDTYRLQPVRQHLIPKAGQPGKYRALGIPSIYDRVCQQALLNRLEPIFEPVFDEANFGYRKGRSSKDALGKIWKEIKGGSEWIVDADLKDFFGSVDQEKLMTLVAQRISDGRVLRLIESMLKAGCWVEGRILPTERGTPQGGVVSPVLSNILLTPFDREMRRKGYRLARYADDWVVTCASRSEAEAALAAASRVLTTLGVTLHTDKTRIVHVRHGFEFLGYKIKQGSRPMQLPVGRIRSGAAPGKLYAYPRQKPIDHFKDEIRKRTTRRAGISTEDVIAWVNPVIKGWGLYFCKAHVRKLFHRLDAWIVHRIWSQHYKRWRCQGGKTLPTPKLYGEMRLVNLVSLIPSLRAGRIPAFVKAGCRKTARPV